MKFVCLIGVLCLVQCARPQMCGCTDPHACGYLAHSTSCTTSADCANVPGTSECKNGTCCIKLECPAGKSPISVCTPPGIVSNDQCNSNNSAGTCENMEAINSMNLGVCCKIIMKIIVDTDVGYDDAGALILALTYSNYSNPVPDILAVTTVFGNVAVVEQAVANASRLLRLTNRTNIPIYAGAEIPLIPVKLIHDSHSSSEYHGKDGLGDTPDVEFKLLPTDFKAAVQCKHAAIGLVELINRFPSEITLVCLGPLTNIALALKLDPSIGKKLKNLVLMGGNIHATGNVLRFVSAEYNFYSDPEAAHIVLEEIKSPITIVPWEVYLSHNADNNFEQEYFSNRTKKSNFMKSIAEMGLKTLKEWNWKLSFCDELAMAVALDPTIVTKYEDHVATVELAGLLTRGQVVIDWKNIDKATIDKATPNVRFVMSYDVQKVQTMLLNSIE